MSCIAKHTPSLATVVLGRERQMRAHEDVVNCDDVVGLLRLLLQLGGHVVVRSTLGETASRLGVILEVGGQIRRALDVVVDVFRVASGIGRAQTDQSCRSPWTRGGAKR